MSEAPAKTKKKEKKGGDEPKEGKAKKLDFEKEKKTKEEKNTEEEALPSPKKPKTKQNRKSVNNLEKTPKSKKKENRSSVSSIPDMPSNLVKSGNDKEQHHEPQNQKHSEANKDQKSLASILLNLGPDSLFSAEKYNELEKLLNDEKFRMDFLKEEGYELLLKQMIKSNNEALIQKGFQIIRNMYEQDIRVFEKLFTNSPYMITCIVWALVKYRKHAGMKKLIYELLSELPAIAKKDERSEAEMQKLIISCFSLYNHKAGEPRMFSHLLVYLNDLNDSQVEEQTIIMRLINQIIEMFSHLESRIAMRLQFTSFNIEEIMDKMYNGGSSRLKQEIDSFKQGSINDSVAYIKQHQDLISEEMYEGSDVEGIMRVSCKRWDSSTLRPIIFQTMCDLLHLPTDELYGVCQWLFINKVVSQLSSPYKNTFVFENNVDFEKILSQIQTENEFKEKIEESENRIEKLKKKLNAEEQKNSALENKISTFEKHQIPKLESSLDENRREIDNLEREKENLESHISDLKSENQGYKSKAEELEEKLSALTDKFNESEENAKKELENMREKLERANQKLIEVMAEEKLRQIKQETENANPDPPPIKKLPTHGSIPTSKIINYKEQEKSADTNFAELVVSDHPDKEERRMFKAISKFTSNSPPTTTVSKRASVVGTVSTTAQYRSVKANANPEAIPEWKKRQMEKEREEAERAEQEHQKKIEAFKSSTLLSQELPSPDTVPEWKLREMEKEKEGNKEPEVAVLLSSSQTPSEISEKELQRLEKTIMSRHSVKK